MGQVISSGLVECTGSRPARGIRVWWVLAAIVLALPTVANAVSMSLDGVDEGQVVHGDHELVAAVAGRPESVVFDLSGPTSQRVVARRQPFTFNIKAPSEDGGSSSDVLDPGEYTLTATVYQSGRALGRRQVRFEVPQPKAQAPAPARAQASTAPQAYLDSSTPRVYTQGAGVSLAVHTQGSALRPSDQVLALAWSYDRDKVVSAFAHELSRASMTITAARMNTLPAGRNQLQLVVRRGGQVISRTRYELVIQPAAAPKPDSADNGDKGKTDAEDVEDAEHNDQEDAAEADAPAFPGLSFSAAAPGAYWQGSGQPITFRVAGDLPEDGNVLALAWHEDEHRVISSFATVVKGEPWRIPAGAMDKLPAGRVQIQLHGRVGDEFTATANHWVNVYAPLPSVVLSQSAPSRVVAGQASAMGFGLSGTLPADAAVRVQAKGQGADSGDGFTIDLTGEPWAVPADRLSALTAGAYTLTFQPHLGEHNGKATSHTVRVVTASGLVPTVSFDTPGPQVQSQGSARSIGLKVEGEMPAGGSIRVEAIGPNGKAVSGFTKEMTAAPWEIGVGSTALLPQGQSTVRVLVRYGNKTVQTLTKAVTVSTSVPELGFPDNFPDQIQLGSASDAAFAVQGVVGDDARVSVSATSVGGDRAIAGFTNAGRTGPWRVQAFQFEALPVGKVRITLSYWQGGVKLSETSRVVRVIPATGSEADEVDAEADKAEDDEADEADEADDSASEAAGLPQISFAADAGATWSGGRAIGLRVNGAMPDNADILVLAWSEDQHQMVSGFHPKLSSAPWVIPAGELAKLPAGRVQLQARPRLDYQIKGNVTHWVQVDRGSDSAGEDGSDQGSTENSTAGGGDSAGDATDTSSTGDNTQTGSEQTTDNGQAADGDSGDSGDGGGDAGDDSGQVSPTPDEGTQSTGTTDPVSPEAPVQGDGAAEPDSTPDDGGDEASDGPGEVKGSDGDVSVVDGGEAGDSDDGETDGWADLTIPAGAFTLYVSDSQGDDENTRETSNTPATPIKTLGKIRDVRIWAERHNKLSSGQPIVLYLKRGDTWSGQNLSVGSNMWVMPYGDESLPRPVIEHDDREGGGTIYLGNGDHDIVISGLVVRGDAAGKTGNDPANHANNCVRLVAKDVHDVLIEGCDFSLAKDNVLLQNTGSDRTGDDGNDGGVYRVTLRRNTIHHAYSSDAGHAQGMYVQGVGELTVDQNIFDHNGWRDDYRQRGWGQPTIFNHNMYTRRNPGMVVKGNIIARASSHGLTMNGGGLAQNNLFYQNSIQLLMKKDVRCLSNVVLSPKNISPDLPRGWGMDFLRLGSKVEIRGNIFAAKAEDIDSSTAINVDQEEPGTTELTVSDNIVHEWRGGIRIEPEGRFVGEVVRNILFDAGDERVMQIVCEDTAALTEDLDLHSNIYALPKNAEDQFLWEVPHGSRHYSGFDGNWPGWFNDRSFRMQPKFVDPDRDLDSYARTLGLSSAADWLQAARANRRGHWNPALTADAVNDYIRAGFERTDIHVSSD